MSSHKSIYAWKDFFCGYRLERFLSRAGFFHNKASWFDAGGEDLDTALVCGRLFAGIDGADDVYERHAEGVGDVDGAGINGDVEIEPLHE